MFASARPFNATTGVDNNGDGINNDRPVINGAVISKSAFRARRLRMSQRSLRSASSFQKARAFCSGWKDSIFSIMETSSARRDNLRRRQTPAPTFGQFVAVWYGNECDSGIREYRPAADVSAAGAV